MVDVADDIAKAPETDLGSISRKYATAFRVYCCCTRKPGFRQAFRAIQARLISGSNMSDHPKRVFCCIYAEQDSVAVVEEGRREQAAHVLHRTNT